MDLFDALKDKIRVQIGDNHIDLVSPTMGHVKELEHEFMHLMKDAKPGETSLEAVQFLHDAPHRLLTLCHEKLREMEDASRHSRQIFALVEAKGEEYVKGLIEKLVFMSGLSGTMLGLAIADMRGKIDVALKEDENTHPDLFRHGEGTEQDHS